jgi:DNA-binding SARP family transcriptional activator
MNPDIKIDPAPLVGAGVKVPTPESAGGIFFAMLRAPALQLASGLVMPLGRKDAAMLAVLAMDGSCSRDALALMLWPGVDLEHARSSLRQRRFRLSQRCGAKLIEGEQTLSLADHVEFAGRNLDRFLNLDAAALDGDLLGGCSYDDCPDLSAWLELARARWRTNRAHALARLASHYETRRELASAVELAKRLAADQELSDHAHRRLMRLHYLRGDLGAAMEVYRNFASRLAQELGEFPDAETEDLALKLRIGQAQPRAVAPIPPTLSLPPRLVGRNAPWAMLEQAWAQRVSVVLEAAPGMGKSRLLHDFVAGQSSSSALLLQGQAPEADRPFALLVRLLQRLSMGGGALWDAGAAALSEWARHGQVQMAEFVVQHIRRAVALGLMNSGLALVAVDDAHYVDKASLELLLAMEGPGLPCFWFTCCPDEVPQPIASWLLRAGAACLSLQLQPWSERDIGELLNDLSLPGLQGAEVAQPLCRHTGGVPRFVLETLRGLCMHPGAQCADIPVPSGALATIRQSKAKLPELARALASYAALRPGALTPHWAAAALGQEPAEGLRALEHVAALQWLDAQCQLHPLVAAALRQDMSPVEKQWLRMKLACPDVPSGQEG